MLQLITETITENRAFVPSLKYVFANLEYCSGILLDHQSINIRTGSIENRILSAK